MAKGNMLQGMARGKVGDVVFSRLNGQQISRVRNRNPRNPRTNPQLYQRAIMATIMQAYSAGKEIFNHSFQGKEVGSGNQRRFMKLNAKALRELIANDLDNAVAVASQKGRVVAPGAIVPTPVIGLQVSEGSMQQSVFTVTPADGATNFSIALPPAVAEETIAQYCARVGLYSGDIYTIVAFIADNSQALFSVIGQTSKYAQHNPTKFGYYRMIVKDTLPATAVASAKLSDIFEIQTEGEVFLSTIGNTTAPAASLGVAALFAQANAVGACALIRSRFDVDLRSSENLVPITATSEFGIASDFALAAWKQGSQSVGDSDLILEGGNF